MDLTVIVPAHNAEEHLPDQLDALIAQEFDGSWELIVVDNRSSDSTPRVVDAYAALDPRVRLVSADERLGSSYARNVGIANARGHGIAFCDSDDVVCGNWVALMARALVSHAFVTGPIDVRELNSPDVVASRGTAITDDSGPPDFFTRFPFAHGCNLGFQKTWALAMKGFDESFAVGEDVEFGLRAWLAGESIHFVPDAMVHYRFRSSGRARWRQATAYGRVRPLMFRRMAGAGIAPPGRLLGLRRWGWLLRQLPRLRDSEHRTRWLWVLATCVGQIEGSIRHHTLYI